MPHKPGHFKPFTSFLNQGMQNTNQNINNINQPNINQPKAFSDSLIGEEIQPPGQTFSAPTGQPGGGGQLFQSPSGGIFDYGDIIGIEGEGVQLNPNENINPGTGGGGGGVAPDPTWDDFWDNWASTIAEGYTSSMGSYADYNMTEGSADYNYLMNQWQQFYNEAGGDVATAGNNFHNWLMSGEYQPSQPKGPEWAINISDFKPLLPDSGGFLDVGDELYKEPIAGAGETGMIGIDPFAPPGVKPGTSIIPRIPGDAINISDFKPINEEEGIPAMPTDELPYGYQWSWNPRVGEWEPVETQIVEEGSQEIGQDVIGGIDLGETDYGLGQTVDIPEYLQGGDYYKPDSSIEDSQESDWLYDLLGGDYNQDGFIDLLDVIQMVNHILGHESGYDVTSIVDVVDTILGNQEDEFSYFTGAPAQAGGGIAGSLARKLYYPSTTGGFASAGSGITGGSSDIMDILKQLQG